jgi:hypothetical protein
MPALSATLKMAMIVAYCRAHGSANSSCTIAIFCPSRFLIASGARISGHY